MKPHRQPRYRFFPAAPILAGVIILASRAGAMAADPETEIGKALGKTLATSLDAQDGVVQDPVLTPWIDRIARRVAAQSPRQNLHYHFTILDSAEANAFTLPGGYVFITRGLLDFARDQDEIAGVLAHEIGHVTARDPMRLIEWQLASSLFVRYGPLPHGENALLAEQGVTLLATLALSRRDEARADLRGIGFATKAGFDPSGLAQFLQDISPRKRPNRLAVLLATHPPDLERIRALDKTPYLQSGDAFMQEAIGDRLSEACRPALASAHYVLAVAAASRIGAPSADLVAKLARARALCGSSRPIPLPSALPPVAMGARPETERPAHAVSSRDDRLPAPGAASRDGGKAGRAPATAPGSRDPLGELRIARDQIQPATQSVRRTLGSFASLQTLNSELRNGLLGAGTTHVNDLRWLALAAQAYADVDRLEDLLARLARVNYRIDDEIAGMEFEAQAYPPDTLRGRTVLSDARSAAVESVAASRGMLEGTRDLERATVLLTSVLADLDSSLLGIGGRVNNLHFAAAEAGLLAVNQAITSGRVGSGRAMEQLARIEDRLLVAQMNRTGDESDLARLQIFDCNVASLLGLSASDVATSRASGDGYGDTVLDLANAAELQATPTALAAERDRLARLSASRGATDLLTPVEAALTEGGPAVNLELILRQAAAMLREESHCG